jgi:uncharacterized protein YacL
MLYRVVIILVFMAGGYVFGLSEGYTYEGVVWGLGIGCLALIVEYVIGRVNTGALIGSIIGLSVGILFSKLLYYPISAFLEGVRNSYVHVLFNIIFGYSGLLVGFRSGSNLTLPRIVNAFKSRMEEENLKILDTSVVIDGRITDVCDVGFMEGTIVLPQFILQELQNIADSSDPMRRARGRRGLEALQKIQKMSNITVKIIDEDFPKIKEVDSKLVALARLLGAKIITNDFNLSKVAQLQGVTVLNFHKLANALKPVVLPGGSMNIFIVKEGKELKQGVGYLDDGTMVVVDNARKFINRNISAVVTSVLQTTAGRMIFAKLSEEPESEDLKVAGN